MKKDEPFNSHNEGIRIVKIAAFCFAIVSWFATAQGLQEYVFNGQYWQACMISFGIQSILFVFNLKLPEYFAQIGKRVPNNLRKYRKYHLGKKRGTFKDTFKWTRLQKIIAFFYVLILLASSFFSFVYMTNLVYKNTRYIDANIVLDRNYRMYLNKVDVYTNEFIKVSQLIINKKLSDLQSLIKDSNVQSERKSKSELQNELIEKEKELNDKIVAQENAQYIFDTAKEIYETPMDVRWRDLSTYNSERMAYETERGKLNAAKEATSVAKLELDKAQLALDNYKPTLNTVVHDLLVATLNFQSNSDELKSLMTQLNDIVLETNESEITAETFAQIVVHTKELSISIDNYHLLNMIQSKEGDNNDIADFKTQMISNEIIVPAPSSESFLEDKEQWETQWKKRFLLLENIIKSVPNYSESTTSAIDNIGEIVDIQSLKEFKAQEISDKIDIIVRTNLANINALERAIKLLVSDFSILAWFSFGIAIFFDISSLLAGLFVYLTPVVRIKKN